MPKEPLRTVLSILLILFIGSAVAWAGSQGGTSVDGWPVFGICAAISFSLNAVVFLHAYRFRTERFFDLTGSITYLVLLGSALLLTDNVSARDLILAGMIACWAIRLGSFLFSRVTLDGADGRFDRVKFQPLQFRMWWILQGLWVLLTAACALAAISSSASPPLGAFAAIGCGLWLLGMVIEIVSDEQKKDFRKRAGNREDFIKTGLWAWSRHPNYFGEITLWAGIAVIALPALSGWQLATLISPVFVYFLLTRISGIPILEARAKRQWGDENEFQEYLKHTPILFPRPPR